MDWLDKRNKKKDKRARSKEQRFGGREVWNKEQRASLPAGRQGVKIWEGEIA